ncbi:MAG TPA: undecaprenyl-diphosphate phosphatase [Coriobacteriia bacterium]|nr:undecaprenyl-diphosphate phosphatase [Coriobacteriia bacterium]
MVEVFYAVLLGVVQGAAEFLPISSSGHLRIMQELFAMPEQFGLAYDLLLHMATLLAVCVYFRDDLSHMARATFSRDPALAGDRRLAWLVVLATVPAGIIGLAGGDFFVGAPVIYVGGALIGTSLILAAADRLSRRSLTAAEHLDWRRALLVGVAQGVAIMPGISRSGATMSMGLAVGLDRAQAARFSFLLSVPIILLAGLSQAYEVLTGQATLPGPVAAIAGVLASGVTGYLAIAGLMSYLKRRSFAVFSVYTAVIGVSVIAWQLTL